EKVTGKLQPASLNSETLQKMKEIESWMTSEEFLLKKTPRIPNGVKIREGVKVLYGLHKAKGGLIRTAEEISESKFKMSPSQGILHFIQRKDSTAWRDLWKRFLWEKKRSLKGWKLSMKRKRLNPRE
ncbi:MAG: hypothetical protein ACXU9P_09130, partial [Thermodesulfobacteriota bacterium]